MKPASQGRIKRLKPAISSIMMAFFLAACSLVTPVAIPEPILEDATATNTMQSVSASETSTPTAENCFWNWAYGDGSTEFDTAVMEEFTANGIQGTVKSSSFGEVYSCENSYSPMSLDVKLEIQVADFRDQRVLIDQADKIFSILQNKLPISNISGLGNVNLAFIDADGNTCYWDRSSSQCAE